MNDFLRPAGVGLLATLLLGAFLLLSRTDLPENSSLGSSPSISPRIKAVPSPPSEAPPSEFTESPALQSIRGKDTKEEKPTVSAEQKEAAFRQLQMMMEREGIPSDSVSSELGQFASIAGRGRQHFPEQDFLIRTDGKGGIVAPNPAQGFEANFSKISGEGLSLTHSRTPASMILRTSRIGSGRVTTRDDGSSIHSGAVSTSGNRVEIDRGRGIVEWYVNRETGLEQGWTFERALQGDRVTIELAIGGEGLTFDSNPGSSRNDPADDRILVRDREGKTVYHYDKLLVTDATGREFPAWMELHDAGAEAAAAGSSITLTAVTSGAQYPLTVDPLVSSELGVFTDYSQSSNARDFIIVGNTLFFTAYTPDFGHELWKTDGTTEGTVLVRDINTGPAGGNLHDFTELNGNLFFIARSREGYSQVFRSDGTTEGTVQITEEDRGVNANYLTRLGNSLLFSGAGGAGVGYELWKSDGTTEGTVLLKDILPGSYQSSLPQYLTPFGNAVYFTAQDTTHGRELWKTDGTESGTVLVSDINPGSAGSDPQKLISVGTAGLFFTANDGTHGVEIWSTQGSEISTAMAKDIVAGTGTATPGDFTPVGDRLFFTANDGSTGKEVWTSDGTSIGTFLLKDIQSGSGTSNPGFLTESNGLLFFAATDATAGRELWKSDGTSQGTSIVRDVRSGSQSSNPQYLADVGGTLYYSAELPSTGHELWMSDGTELGTSQVIEVAPGSDGSYPLSFFDFQGSLYFTARIFREGTQQSEYELWKSDGTQNGTELLKDINRNGEVFLEGQMALLGDVLYFAADDGVSGTELWKSDGTPGGTVLVKDIVSGSSGSFPGSLTVVGSTLFFVADDGTSGIELWKSDGTGNGTVLVEDIWSGISSSNPRELTAFGGELFFAAYEAYQQVELWKSDGTPGGTGRVAKINPSGSSYPYRLTPGDTLLYFGATHPDTGYEIYTTDGTEGGTRLVADLAPGTTGTGIVRSATLGDTLIFAGGSGSLTWEMWKSDGTAQGSGLLKDIYPGSTGSFPTYLTTIGNNVFFRAKTSTSGEELWRTDGTEQGTVLVKDIRPGSFGSNPYNFRAVSGTLFFSGFDYPEQRELWRSDGTEAGTFIVHDTNPWGSADPNHLAAAGSDVFFAATDGESGIELWRSNGTSAGTLRVEDGGPEHESSFPADIIASGTNLFYTTAHPAGGRTLRILPLTPPLVINEVDAHVDAAADREFVELFDGGTGNTPLDGTVLVLFDGTSDQSYLAVDLDGQSTDADGYFVIGNADTPSVDFLIPDDSIRDGTHAVALYRGDDSDFPSGSAPTVPGLLDAFVYGEEGSASGDLLALLGSGEVPVNEDASGSPLHHSLQRLPNGNGGLRDTTFYTAISPTPGAANSLPPAPEDLDLVDASDLGESSSDDITRDDTPTIDGTARPGSTVRLSSHSAGPAGTTVTRPDGTWSITTPPLSDGYHLITATADDGPSSSQLPVVIDTIAPNAPSNLDLKTTSDTGTNLFDNITNDDTPDITGTAHGNARVTLFSGTTEVGSAVSTGIWTITSDSLADSTHSLTARSTDTAGNESAASTMLSVTVDTTPPSVNVTVAAGQSDPAPGGPVLFTAAFSETITGFVNSDINTGGNAAGAVSVSGGLASYTLSVAATADEGFVTASIAGGIATDTAGNPNTASTSTDNRVDLDSHNDSSGTPTPLLLSSGTGSVSAFLHPGDTDTFSFTLTDPRIASVYTTGSVDTRGELRDSLTVLRNDPDSDDDAGDSLNFRSTVPLPAGDYTVTVSANSGEGDYTLHMEATDTPNIQPDLTINGRGDGIYETLTGQKATLTAKKARTVRGTALVQNDGEIADTFLLQAGAGNSLFQVTYTSETEGNISAALIAGTHQSAVLAPGESAESITATIRPNKRKLKKVKRVRGRKKTIYKKKRFQTVLSAQSQALDTQSDTSAIQVKVK